MYSSYTAATFGRKHELADRRGVNLQGAVTWAFEFEDQSYFDGFRDPNLVNILIWHYHDDDRPAPAARIALSITGVPPSQTPVFTRHFRVDENHSNSYALWKETGSPQKPTPEQYNRLQRAGQLQMLALLSG